MEKKVDKIKFTEWIIKDHEEQVRYWKKKLIELKLEKNV